jgi:hypothetical protein
MKVNAIDSERHFPSSEVSNLDAFIPMPIQTPALVMPGVPVSNRHDVWKTFVGELMSGISAAS